MVTGNVIKRNIVHFKLKHFCWIAPVNYGVLLLGYFNLLFTVICILSTVNDSFSPPLKKLQEIVLEDQANTSTGCTLAYSIEQAVIVMVLVGMHRRDVVLLCFYLYLGVAEWALILFAYVTVIMKIDILTSSIVVIELLYQCYFLLLVRSAMVNFKEERKAKELEKVMEKQKNKDLEIGEESASEQEYEVNPESVAPDYKKLDTLLETSDEDSSTKDDH